MNWSPAQLRRLTVLLLLVACGDGPVVVLELPTNDAGSASESQDADSSSEEGDEDEACTGDHDCRDEDRPLCALPRARCVECRVDADCTSDEQPHCDDEDGECERCDSDDEDCD